jgi:hypothetical protein
MSMVGSCERPRPIVFARDPLEPITCSDSRSLPSIPDHLRGCDAGLLNPPHLAVALQVMNEPSLCGLRDESVRFTWEGSFVTPVMIRVTSSPAGRELVAMRIERASRGEPRVQWRKRRSVTGDEWHELLVRTSRLRRNPCGPRGPDGATWTLETTAGVPYRAYSAWSPAEGDPVHAAGSYMFELAGLTEADVWRSEGAQ